MSRELGDDSVEVRFAEPASSLLTTVDLLYHFGQAAARFGRIAAIHAMSDIYATLGEPVFATVVLGVSRADVASGRAEHVEEGLADALRQHDVLLAGGHTAMADDTFAAVTVLGRRQGRMDFGAVQETDLVVLSKPLGTGLAITAERLQIATAFELEPVYAGMLTSNREAALTLKGCMSDIGSVRAVTDVSGFGLLDALRSLAPGAAIRLGADRIPFWPSAPRYIAEQAWSGLSDSNALAALEFTKFCHGVDQPFLLPLLSDPQTSGGLLAIVSPAAAAELSRNERVDFAVIGSVNSVGEEGAQVEICPTVESL